MRLKFWKLVHWQLERMWHWVYYKKVAPEVITISSMALGPYSYTVSFVTKDGFATGNTES